jgi:hypothetical protein
MSTATEWLPLPLLLPFVYYFIYVILKYKKILRVNFLVSEKRAIRKWLCFRLLLFRALFEAAIKHNK